MELLVVIAIIGILIALLLPAVQSAREAARQMQCRNHLKQIGLALHNYHVAHSMLPSGADYSSCVGSTWAAAILPYLELQSLFDRFNFEVPIWHADNVEAVQVVIATYICPSDGSSDDPLLGGRIQTGDNNPGKSMGLWYPASMGPTRDGWYPGAFCVYCPEGVGSYCCADTSTLGKGVDAGAGLFGRGPTAVCFAKVRDGLSNTLMVGESIPSQCAFNGAYNHNFPVAGTTIPLNTFEGSTEGVPDQWYTACGFKSRHPGGANFLLADGSVHFLSDSIDYKLYNELGSRSGGEVVTLQ